MRAVVTILYASAGTRKHAPQHDFHRGRAFEVVVRENEPHAAPEYVELLYGDFGGLYLQIDGARPGFDRGVQNADLVLDAPVEAAVILVAAASGKNLALRVAGEQMTHHTNTLLRIVQVVQTEFQESLSGVDLMTGLFQQLVRGREAERNGNARQ